MKDHSLSKYSKSAYILCLTTDPEGLPPMKFLKTYFNTTLCKNIFSPKDYHVEYDRQINDETIHLTFREIKLKEESYSLIKSKINSIIIIANIEKSASFNLIDNIISFLIDCGNDRRCYILGFYNYQSNIQHKFKEENFANYLNTKRIDYDYIDVNQADNVSQVKILDFITQETINKKQKEINTMAAELTVDDNSKSMCYLF